MISKEYNLPKYPCQQDVWDILSKETRPILVYGMGNGADKLFRRFEKYGIKVSEVFASDGFVRGHSFRGFKVKSFSEVKNEYSDFVIVLSFATNRSEVIKMLSEIDKEHEMYAPDMPISDEEEYFDREFYNSHYLKIKDTYESLCDEKSRQIYAAVLNYRITGKINYLLSAWTDKEEMYSLISKKEIKTVIDLGAYNGDTAKEAMMFFPALTQIFAVEPDPKNYKKLVRFCDTCDFDIKMYNAAVWSECGYGSFCGSANRNSTLSATASYQHADLTTETITVDSLGVEADYIKYDVEGAEYEALVGSEKTIKHSSPVLLVSLYHKSKDIFFLPHYISQNYPSYKLYLRRMYSIPAWELNLIALPIE